MLDWNGNGKIDPIDIGIGVAMMNENDNTNSNESDTDNIKAGERNCSLIEEKPVLKPVGCLTMFMMTIAIIALSVGFVCVYLL